MLSATAGPVERERIRPATRTAANRPPSRPARWAPYGFAAIPTAALDPPHSAASPAVPALVGSGSPSGPVRPPAAAERPAGRRRLPMSRRSAACAGTRIRKGRGACPQHKNNIWGENVGSVLFSSDSRRFFQGLRELDRCSPTGSPARSRTAAPEPSGWRHEGSMGEVPANRRGQRARATGTGARRRRRHSALIRRDRSGYMARHERRA